MDDAKGPASSNVLRSAQFEGLLQRLDPNRDRAGELYEKLRRRLIKFFEWNSCFPAEDLTDETLDRVAQKLTVEVIHDLHAYASGVAKRVRQEAYKQAGKNVPVPDLPNQENFFQDPKNPEQIMQDKAEGQRRSDCLRLCMQRLAGRDRELFLDYHHAADQRMQHRLEIARNLGVTIGTLRVKINRLRDELETCARKCVASSGVGPAGGRSMQA
jgi:DNA-directed RNA polymerase specialized sigma24 family protein